MAFQLHTSDNPPDKLALLVNFGNQIAQENHLGPLLELIAEKVREILDADRCSVFLYDEKNQQLWSHIAHGLPDQIIRLPLGQGIVGLVAETLQTINIKNAYQNEYFNRDVDESSGYTTITILGMPLKNKHNKLLGVFQVLNKKHGIFNESDEGILKMLGALAASAIENAQLYEDIRYSQLETIMRLAMAAESRDQVDLAGHLKRISGYSALIAEAMGLTPELVEAIQYASPLHDIGKISIPDFVLKKPGKLEGEELVEMHQHPTRGAKILENAESSLLKIAYNIAYAHHERYDGMGYPRRLAGENIPIEARIVALADVFDALMSKRVYKPSWSLDKTTSYIRENSGTQFDPAVVTAFFKCFNNIKRDWQNLHLR